MALVVIPARLASTRLPNKPLADIAGRPMIEHVYRQASAARGVDRVVVATDHESIMEVVRGFGGEAVMTGECASGTDRVAEAARKYENIDIIVNVQGDEPLLKPEALEEILAPFGSDPSVRMASLKRRFRDDENPADPDKVKVVTDLKENAIYFSRSLIPFPRHSGKYGPFLHVGIYAFRRETLFEFAGLAPTPIEKAESLEQLRALEHGIKIKVPTTEHYFVGVDTPEDLEKVRGIFEG